MVRGPLEEIPMTPQINEIILQKRLIFLGNFYHKHSTILGKFVLAKNVLLLEEFLEVGKLVTQNKTPTDDQERSFTFSQFLSSFPVSFPDIIFVFTKSSSRTLTTLKTFSHTTVRPFFSHPLLLTNT